MRTFDLTPLYRNSVGFDHLNSLLNSAMRADAGTSYPPYNIEVLGENSYAITLSVAGFDQSELDITVEKNVLSVSGKKANSEEKKYLHQGIASRAFERKFNLADHVEVKGADLNQGLLTINLVREIPDAVKPRTISIGGNSKVLEANRESANQEQDNHKQQDDEQKIA